MEAALGRRGLQLTRRRRRPEQRGAGWACVSVRVRTWGQASVGADRVRAVVLCMRARGEGGVGWAPVGVGDEGDAAGRLEDLAVNGSRSR
jgi:hypothetical protein